MNPISPTVNFKTILDDPEKISDGILAVTSAHPYYKQQLGGIIQRKTNQISGIKFFEFST